MARHTRALLTGTRVALLMHPPVAPGADPLQTPRLMMRATVSMLERGSSAFESARERFVSRFATAAMTLELADFNLYQLEFDGGRYVAGFAQAYDVGRLGRA